MKRPNKKIIKESIFSTLIGVGLYVVAIFVLPTIKVNSIIDIVIFSACIILGGVIYSLIQKKSDENKST